MSDMTIKVDDFRSGLFAILNEGLEKTEDSNMFLDKGDDLRNTLAGVSAEQASIVTGSCGNSIASQLRHMAYYFEVATQHLSGNAPENVDWSAAWKQTSVSDEEWKTLQNDFWMWKGRMDDALSQDPPTFGEDEVTGSIAVVAHCAFHLGQIRHALCMAK